MYSNEQKKLYGRGTIYSVARRACVVTPKIEKIKHATIYEITILLKIV